MYENLELDLDLKLLFMVTGAYYESGLLANFADFKAFVCGYIDRHVQIRDIF